MAVVESFLCIVFDHVCGYSCLNPFRDTVVGGFLRSDIYSWAKHFTWQEQSGHRKMKKNGHCTLNDLVLTYNAVRPRKRKRKNVAGEMELPASQSETVPVEALPASQSGIAAESSPRRSSPKNTPTTTDTVPVEALPASQSGQSLWNDEGPAGFTIGESGCRGRS